MQVMMMEIRTTALIGLVCLVALVTCLEGDNLEEKRAREITDDDAMNLENDLDMEDKRNYIMRYGKRGPLMRYGKRGTLMRYGKRGPLMRYGKRADDVTTLLRWGKRAGYDSSADLDEKRTQLFRYGKRTDSTSSNTRPENLTPEDYAYAKRLFRYGKRGMLPEVDRYDALDELVGDSDNAGLNWEEKRTLLRYGRDVRSAQDPAAPVVPFRFGEERREE